MAEIDGKPISGEHGEHVEVYRDKAGEYRWRHVGANNSDIVAESGEGYVNLAYAIERGAKQAVAHGIPFYVIAPTEHWGAGHGRIAEVFLPEGKRKDDQVATDPTE